MVNNFESLPLYCPSFSSIKPSNPSIHRLPFFTIKVLQLHHLLPETRLPTSNNLAAAAHIKPAPVLHAKGGFISTATLN
jgi:hypothetical protein